LTGAGGGAGPSFLFAKEVFLLEKKRWRRQLLAIRDGLAPRARQHGSESITGHLLAWPAFQAARVVMFYAAQGSEVDTWRGQAIARAMGKKTVLPVTLPATKQLQPYFVTGPHELVTGPYGIKQPDPECCRVCPRGEIDLVLVPGVGFDARGNRLGHGAGYYDRFLRGLPAKRVGLAFSCQIIARVPVGPHDVPLGAIIMEQGVLLGEG
jgi:5-formyltetrahydrofolate cyclo-ligase